MNIEITNELLLNMAEKHVNELVDSRFKEILDKKVMDKIGLAIDIELGLHTSVFDKLGFIIRTTTKEVVLEYLKDTNFYSEENMKKLSESISYEIVTNLEDRIKRSIYYGFNPDTEEEDDDD